MRLRERIRTRPKALEPTLPRVQAVAWVEAWVAEVAPVLTEAVASAVADLADLVASRPSTTPVAIPMDPPF